jgi:hypothetical protein
MQSPPVLMVTRSQFLHEFDPNSHQTLHKLCLKDEESDEQNICSCSNDHSGQF